MMCDHASAAPVGVQMARDGLELMTQPQRLALAIEIVLGIDAPSCTQHLIRLSNQAISTSHEIAGREMLAQYKERA
tara:strand:- start:684 stop:911 length:228 start_codon:yes stop_codon:yes gene_type:complete